MNAHNPLPERILQFGTGILLRGLPDYFVDKANKQGVFNGKILVVKSTGSINDFSSENLRFTTHVRGMENGKVIEEDFTNESISRVMPAHGQWPEILMAVQNPDLQLIISNTTEVGLQWLEESIFQTPPMSFPAKLTAVLYERFKKLGEDSPETVVIPTELIPANGEKLKGIVHRLMRHNDLEAEFGDWMERKIIFCNSLVDRIVTLPSAITKNSSQDVDTLAIQTEPYKLWAIEGDRRVKQLLTFAQADSGVIIANNIEDYRERKLRLLNGTHTFFVCLGILQGHTTVLECMRDERMVKFIQNIMLSEILPTLPTDTETSNRKFGVDVLERFSNPFTEHRLLNITLQSTAKMKMRNIPTLIRYVDKFGKIPELMAHGFAAYLVFMKSEKRDGQFYGRRRQGEYLIQDDAAEYFCEEWKNGDTKKMVARIAANTALWESDLSKLPDFVVAVNAHITGLTRGTT